MLIGTVKTNIMDLLKLVNGNKANLVFYRGTA